MASLNMSGLQRPATVEGSIPWVVGGYDDDVIRCSPRFAMGSWGNDWFTARDGYRDRLFGESGFDYVIADPLLDELTGMERFAV
jgi:hypothetical protein